MAKVDKIEIDGMKELQAALKGLPDELNASIIRNVARKPANKVVSEARKLFTYKDTGKSKRSFGILRVKDRLQKYIEVGIKGRSLAYIFLFSRGQERKTKAGAERGRIEPLGNIIQEAADRASNGVVKEMQVDLTKIIARYIRRKVK